MSWCVSFMSMIGNMVTWIGRSSFGGRLIRPSVTRMPPGREDDFGDSTITHFPTSGVLHLTDPSRTLVCPVAMVSKSLP